MSTAPTDSTSSGLGEKFPLHATFLSDWHVGTGAGRVGGVDACVHRDENDLPFLPAKTLTGVWRDACAYVAEVLDGRGAIDLGSGPTASLRRWATWVDALFGTDKGRPALLGIGPARLPEDVAAVLRAFPPLGEALISRRPGVAIDLFSGTAHEDSLRLEERVVSDLTLTAQVQLLRLPGRELPEAAELLLRAGARLLDGLGGKRTRGAGRIICWLGDNPEAAQNGDRTAAEPTDLRLHALLDDPHLLADPGFPPEPPVAPSGLRLGVRVIDRAVHRVVLRTLTPLVVPDRLRGNLQTSHDRVLGTGLLPALLPWVEGTVTLGDIRVGDAVPAVRADDGAVVPAYAVPKVWHRANKGRGSTVLDVSRQAPTPQQKARPATGRVAHTGDRSWTVVEIGHTDRTHAVIDPEERRPVESAGGGLFTFQGIPAGTLLVSDVVLPVDATLNIPNGERLKLGRSRKDDYGEVEVVTVRRLPEARRRTDATDSGSRGEEPRTLAVWCVSDVLLRNERLAPDPTPRALARELSGLLKTKLTALPRQGEGDTAGLRPSVTAATRREGFAVRWGRPRPTQVALAAGSVVRLAITGPPPDPGALARIERDGVGRRTAEGFGAVRFDPPELTAPDVRLATPRKPKRRGEVPDEWPSSPLLQNLLEDAWRAVIRRRVDELAATGRLPQVLPGMTVHQPGASQLGQLRAQLERLDHPQAVAEWFDGATRSRTWPLAALAAAQALLLDRAAATAPVWRHLALADADQITAVQLPAPDLIDPRDILYRYAVTLLVVALHRHVRTPDDREPTSGDQSAPAVTARSTTRRPRTSGGSR